MYKKGDIVVQKYHGTNGMILILKVHKYKYTSPMWGHFYRYEMLHSDLLEYTRKGILQGMVSSKNLCNSGEHGLNLLKILFGDKNV